MSKVFILTGAAGLLGSNISRQLVAQGETVRALVLNGDPAARYVPLEAQIVYGDLLDKASLEELFTVPEGSEVYVLHCASIVTLNPAPNPKVHAVNVDGTRNILDKCLEHRVKKLVYVSSTGAIPELPHGQKIKEVDRFLPTDGLVGYYSITKAEASQLVLDAVREHPELDASIVHPSGICGPNDYAFGPVSQIVSQYISGEMKIGIEGTFNSVDVRDLADGVITCCERGGRGECYIMSNELVTMRELYDVINEAADLEIHASILSKGVASAAVKLLKLQSKVTGKEPLLNDFALYNLTRNNDFDCSKAQRELGFSCRPFQETIRDEVEWLREEAANAPEISEEAKKTAEEIHRRVKIGDVARVIVKNESGAGLTLPLGQSIATGVSGAILAPYAILPALLAAAGSHTKILLEKKDGTVVDLKGELAEGAPGSDGE